MASRTVVDCDRCKKEIPPKMLTQVAVYVDDSMDPCGSRDYEQDVADLCPECVSYALLSIVGLMPRYDYKANKALMKGLLDGDRATLRTALAAIAKSTEVAGSV